MTLLLLAAITVGALAVPSTSSSSSPNDGSSGRSYSTDSYGGNSYVVSSYHQVADTAPSNSNAYATQDYANDYSSKDTANYGSDYSRRGTYDYGNAYRVRETSNYGGNYNTDYTNTGYNQPTSQAQPQYKNLNSYVLDRFHPTTYSKDEEDSHTGEVVLSPIQDNRPAATHDSVASASTQESFLQVPDSFASDLAAQTSDTISLQVDSVPVATGQDAHYDYAPPLPSGYDYHPPPPPPTPAATPYYYYPPPAPPTNQYLPVPTSPPPPPPPAPEEERQVDYSYYYLGPKLWYVPLFFSIYFVIYVGALIIKAISKHKILFPQQLYNAASSVYTGRGVGVVEARATLDQLTARVTRALASATIRYLRQHDLAHD